MIFANVENHTDPGGLADQVFQEFYKRSEHVARATRTYKEASLLTQTKIQNSYHPRGDWRGCFWKNEGGSNGL